MHTIYSGALKDTNQDSEPKPPKLLDRLRQALRVKHYAYHMEQAYVQWGKRFTLYHIPQEMGGSVIERYLTALAVRPHSDRR